ncbi:major capsid protein [Snodgrassella alvi]|uniref:major capsid protein n=1 Tax=Snodgrassella alvi TaxID=1196083 RepID=UPI000C1EEE3B|nr:major capsid protein [Snodgrassella alvi]PIT48539.1 hypothetical protein BHC51_04655 [Snodgrassella alvi]
MPFDLTVFNKETYTTMVETVAQDIDKFNQASGGTITLINRPSRGDQDVYSKFQGISDLVRRRNVYGDGAVASVRLTQTLENSVKVAAGTPPVEYEPAQYAWIKQNPTDAAIALGTQLGKGRMADMLNTGIMCAVAAIKNNPKATRSGYARPDTMVNAAALFGDRSSAIKAWVMHSACSTDLLNYALNNDHRLFAYDTVNITQDPAGRLFIITDSPYLVKYSDPAKPDASSLDGYFTLGLTEDGIVVSDNDDYNSAIVDITGKENLHVQQQAEWSYNVAVKGYRWDMAKGGASPTNLALATGTNWTQVPESVKNTAGVLAIMSPTYI